MFKNCANKIKTLASVLFWLGLIGSFIGAIVLWAEGTDELVGIGFAVLFGGIFGSFSITLLMYGFGQLIENSDKIAKNTQGAKAKKVEAPAAEIKNEDASDAQEVTSEMLGDCDLCGKQGVPVVKASISDEYGTRYRTVCLDCFNKHNAKRN